LTNIESQAHSSRLEALHVRNRRFGAVQSVVLVAVSVMGAACSGEAPVPIRASVGSAMGSNGSSALGGEMATDAATGNSSGATTGGSGGSGESGDDASASSAAPDSAASSSPDAGVSSGLPPTSVCYGAGTRPLTKSKADAFIDDFEEGAISPGWSSFSDVMPKQNAFQIMQVHGGALGTAHSGHYAGTGAVTTSKGGFGVGAVYNTAIDPAAHIYCVDISAFDGVSFWAKAAKSGSTVALNFVLPQTNMVSADGMGRPNGGDCTMNCYNHPYVSVTLTAGWTQYAVRFADAGGAKTTVGGVIQELAWLSPDSSWDFWLDEIAFYQGTPPTGPVGPGR
jgi:hypothetical protein